MNPNPQTPTLFRACPHCLGSLTQYEDPLAVEIIARLERELAEAKAKLDYVAKLGLQFGMMKSSDKPAPYLAHTWAEDSEHERMFREWSKSIGLEATNDSLRAELDAAKRHMNDNASAAEALSNALEQCNADKERAEADAASMKAYALKLDDWNDQLQHRESKLREALEKIKRRERPMISELGKPFIGHDQAIAQQALTEVGSPKKCAIHPDDKRLLDWIEKRIGQLGIEVRQSKHHIQMRYYLELLENEIAMTKQFLSEDGSPTLAEKEKQG